MSILDQAFIRAYERDSARAEAARRRQSAPTAVPHAPAMPSRIACERESSPAMEDSYAQVEWYQLDRLASAPDLNRSATTAAAQADLAWPDGSCTWILPPSLDYRCDNEPSRPPEPIATRTIRVDAVHQVMVPSPHFAAANGSATSNSPLGDFPESNRASYSGTDDPSAGPTSCQHLPTVAKAFRPAWEVDRVRWPSVCDDLAAQRAGALQGVASRLLATAHCGRRVLAVASCLRREGRTTLALCLARMMAASGARVLLVDADFQNPQIADRLGVAVPGGWEQAIVDRSPLNECAVCSVGDRLSLLPLSHDGTHGRITLADRRVYQLLRFASDWFDSVVVDIGPDVDGIGAVATDAPESPLDGAVLVRDARRTSAGDAERFTMQLRKSDLEVLGIVENFWNE